MRQNLLAEAQWLRDNPHFSERPASIREFMGPDYLALVDTIRPGVLEVLVEIFGEEVDPQSYEAHFEPAAALIADLVLGEDYVDFLTLPAYELLEQSDRDRVATK